ncbi:MAG: hypothetical protein LBR33_03945 [Propionibacteriaceae bacterium]|nr:hypothetical protein [Propionibacteriaceae bacterium]
MDTTGLIFVVVVVAWLVYLLPHHLAGKTPATPDDDAGPVPTELTVTLHKGTPKPVDPFPEESTEDLLGALFDLPVSTELIRRAQKRELRLMAQRSARARRRSLTAGVLVALVALGVYLAGLTSWVTPAVAGGALVLGVVLARWNVVRVQRKLDRLRQSIDRGEDELTVPIYIETELSAEADREDSIDLTQAIGEAQLSLWDPLPVPAATYVSKPLAPRTIRTIDLATPIPPQPVPVVTAEGPGNPDRPEEWTEEISEAV